MRLLLLVVFVVSCATKPLKKPEAQAALAKPVAYTGLQFSAQTLKFNPPLKGSINEAIRIENVMPDSPASKVGLRAGDLILDERDPVILSKKFGESPAGSSFKLKILSGVQIKDVTLVSDTRSPSQGHLIYKKPASLWKIPTQKTFLQQKVGVLENKKLADVFKEMSSKGDALRPQILRFIQENPLSTQEVSQELLRRLRSCLDSAECLGDLDLLDSKAVSKIKIQGSSKEAHVDYLRRVIAKARDIHSQAFAKLSKREIAYLEDNVDEVSNRFMESLYVHDDMFIRRKNRFYEITQILDKIDLGKFQETLVFLASHLNKNYFVKLKKDIGKIHETIQFKTSLGRIVIAGQTDNDHSEYSKEKILMLIDLGGDDLYRDVSGMIVDLSGNDRYESSLSWALGAAKMGTSLFMDFEGSDIYECGVHCLGSSFLGSALFVDLQGNDSYSSQVYSQGSAFTGVTLFMDDEGNDTYTSFGFSQGVGIAGGLGILIDNKGNDTYRSLGIRPSGYGDPGQYESWSQGVGIGLRFFVSGGTGLLYDREGQDLFDSGTFSQGGGYAFGFGALLNDGKENDVYKGMRYGQAFAAHGGAGFLIESGGNDQYFSLSSVCQSIAWDLGVTFFEDKEGNDRHQAGVLCLGAPSHSSYAFFFDNAGVDNYVGKELPATSSLPSDYHDTPSVGYFLDSGFQEDVYQNFLNNTCQKRTGVQIVCDE